MDVGFPELTDSFQLGRDVLYGQFNDVNFYVEDTKQEHFYHNVLKKLFPDVKIEKIFPLNGKTNVINDAKLNITNKKKVYIVDLDFDHILKKTENLNNVFYLKKYSIENYLPTKSAIYELIRVKEPKLKNQEIDALFCFDTLLNLAVNCLKELASIFAIIQKHKLGITYHSLNLARDFDFSTSHPTYRMNFIPNYKRRVERKLKRK
ncbi:MAG TPA: DUF4435 domain-containing protein, partial [Bacteroidia bacterium]|nr:DUF4435 domain-containing protein [Bacteroidia bacterium]